MQITEALLSEPGDIWRFVQQAVDHWPRLLAVHFTLYSAEGNINGQQIHAFCTAFYRQVQEHITERNHTASPAPPVVLRWLLEQHGEATIRCLLLLSGRAFAICGSVPQLMKNVRKWWIYCNRPGSGINAGGQCRLESCFQVDRSGTLDQFVVLKTTVQSLMLPVMATIAVIIWYVTGSSVDSYGLIKFCLLNFYTEFFSVCVHELTIWRINTVLQN